MPRSNTSSCVHESFAVCTPASTQVSKLAVLVCLLLIGICCATVLRFANLNCITRFDEKSHSSKTSALLIRPLNRTKEEVAYIHLENSEFGIFQCKSLVYIGASDYHADVYKTHCVKHFSAEDPLDTLFKHGCRSIEWVLERMHLMGSGLEKLVPDIVSFGCIVVSGALVWLICYLYFAALLAGAVLVAFVRVGLKAVIDMLYIGLRPVRIACFIASLSPQSTVACVAAWLELALCLVSWTVLLNGVSLLLIAGYNLPLKVTFGSMLALAMLFLPRALSYLELSPLSKYLALNSVSGFSLGLAYLARTTIEKYPSFSTPR